MEYWSQSAQSWLPTNVQKVGGDGSVNVHCKPSEWIRVEDQSSRLRQFDGTPIIAWRIKSHEPPMPTSPLPAAKAPRCTHTDLTPGATSTAEASASHPSQDASGNPGRDPWATAAAQLPGAAGAPPRNASPQTPALIGFEQMKDLPNQQTLQLNTSIAGVEQRLGQRIGAVETTQEEHGTKLEDLHKYNDVQDQRVAELEKQMFVLCRSGPAAASAQYDPNNGKQAFLGKLPRRISATIKLAVEGFVDKPEGFVGVEVFGNVNTGAVVEFATAEAMNKFVTDNETRAAEAGRFLKHNRAPLSMEERNRRALIWQGKQKLIAKGVPKDNALFSRSRFWIAQVTGEVQEVGKIEGDAITWNDSAPEGVNDA